MGNKALTEEPGGKKSQEQDKWLEMASCVFRSKELSGKLVKSE